MSKADTVGWQGLKMIYSRISGSYSGSSLQRKEKTFYQRVRRVFGREQLEPGKQ